MYENIKEVDVRKIKKTNRLIELETERSNHISLMLPLIFSFSGFLHVFMILFKKTEFTFLPFIYLFLGGIVGVYKIKEIKKNKIEIKKLREELNL